MADAQDPIAAFLSQSSAPADPIADYLNRPAPAKLNAAGLPEASGAVARAGSDAKSFVERATAPRPQIDPRSGMAIPQAGQPPIVNVQPVMTPMDRLKRLALGTPGNPTSIRLALPQPRPLGAGQALNAPLIDTSALTDEQDAPTTTAGKLLTGAAGGILDTAQGLTSPLNVGILAAAGGAGALPKVAALVTSKLVSLGFSADMLHGAYEQIPELREAMNRGDATTATRIATRMGLSVGMGAAAGHHAVEGVPAAIDSAIDSHNSTAADLVKQDAGEAKPFLPPAEGKFTADALDRLQKIEPDAAKRAALAAEAKKRNLPVPARDPIADFLNAEEAKPAEKPGTQPAAPAQPTGVEDQYRALFDEADKRMATAQKRAAQTPPEVPEEGVDENVSRVVDARSRLAQTLLNKPWDQVSNSEAGTIDDLVRQGFGKSAQPGEKGKADASTATETPASPGAVQTEDTIARKPDATAQTSGPVAYGKPTVIRVAGEDTAYPARYAVRESDDVQASHNPTNFEPNPAYPHSNERDYSNPENAARVVEYSMPGKFNPDYTLTESPTAEHGATVTDQAGNALGGNNRAMTIARAYDHPQLGPMYRAALESKAKQFGIDPAELSKFQQPTLTRELTGSDVDPQKAISDFNKAAPAALMPEEQAVADGKRLSPETLASVSGMIEDHGNGGTLADALRGDNGAEVAQHLVDDGVITDQEKNGMVDGQGNLTADAKSRVAKALTGRLFDSSADYAAAGPELRAKLERVAPQVFRVEGRPEWALGDHVKDAVGALNEAKARGVDNLDDLANQQGLDGKTREITPEAMAIARKLQEGPVKAAAAFRQYANDEQLSRPGNQGAFFEPPTREESFESAFGGSEPSNGAKAEELPGASEDRGSPARTLPRENLQPAENSRPTSPARDRGDKPNPFVRKVLDVAKSVTGQARSIQKVFAPQTLDYSGEQASFIMRGRLAEAERAYDQAEYSLRDARKMFDRMPEKANEDFIDRVESGRAQTAPELDPIAKVMRGILDPRRRAVQELGKGKLQQFFENYFPHVWKKFDSAKQVIGSMMGRRPLEGSKGFLKQRTHLTFADGRAAGLEPVSKNPVDLVLLKAREMDRYLLGHRALEDFKEQGIAKYVDAREGKAPAGWIKIADPIGAVYGPSKIPVEEYQNEGLHRGLSNFADSLGLNHEREMKLPGRGRLGQAGPKGTDELMTKFGTDPQTLAHEIGHHLEWKFGMSDALMRHPDARTRIQMNRELRDLADLRREGETVSPSDRAYIRSKDEKMAAVVQAYVAAKERMKRVAPTVMREFEALIDRNPALKPLRKIEPNLKHLPLQDEVDAGGMVTKGNYYAPESAATLINNHLAPGLSASAAYRAGVGVNNGLNQFQLGASAFHLTKVGVESMIQRHGLGFEQAMRGHPLEGLKTMASAPIAPFTNMLKGDKMLKEWYRPGASGGLIGAYVDRLQDAGGRARMSDFYESRIGDKMMRMFRQGGVGNTLGGILRAPAAAVEYIPQLIMKEVVPRLKMGAFADAARYDLERLGPAGPEAVRKSLSQTWDSIEDRMGQMTRDNLFWHRTASDIAGLMTRSVGWNLGTLRGVGGGILDMAKVPFDLATGRKTYDQVNLRRIANNASMLTMTMAWGALRTYMNTGQGPQTMKDYLFPRKADGTRESPLSYVTDAYEFATSPLHTLANKAAPLVSLVSALAANKDYKGDKIWDPDETAGEKLGDAAKYSAKDAEPLSVRQYLDGREEGRSTMDQLAPSLGIRNAPRDIDQTEAESAASQIAASEMSSEGRSKVQAGRHDAEHAITQLARAGKPAGPAIAAALKAGTLNSKQIRETIENAHLTPLQSQVHKMGVEAALRVWDKATPEERRTLRPILAKKQSGLMDAPAAERAVLTPRLQQALRGN